MLKTSMPSNVKSWKLICANEQHDKHVKHCYRQTRFREAIIYTPATLPSNEMFLQLSNRVYIYIIGVSILGGHRNSRDNSRKMNVAAILLVASVPWVIAYPGSIDDKSVSISEFIVPRREFDSTIDTIYNSIYLTID